MYRAMRAARSTTVSAWEPVYGGGPSAGGGRRAGPPSGVGALLGHVGDRGRVVNAQLGVRTVGDLRVDPPLTAERRQHRHDDRLGVDLEVPTGTRPRVGEAEPVGAERGPGARHPARDLVRDGAHVVAGRDGGAALAEPL